MFGLSIPKFFLKLSAYDFDNLSNFLISSLVKIGPTVICCFEILSQKASDKGNLNK